MLRRHFCASLRRTLSTNVSGSSAKTDGQLYDIAIVGGGPVGNAMACSIGKLQNFKTFILILGHNKWLNDKRVLLLESSQPKRLGSAPEKYSNRVFACSPASVRMFKG